VSESSVRGLVNAGGSFDLMVFNFGNDRPVHASNVERNVDIGGSDLATAA
jgi:hypothetical protein